MPSVSFRIDRTDLIQVYKGFKNPGPGLRSESLRGHRLELANELFFAKIRRDQSG